MRTNIALIYALFLSFLRHQGNFLSWFRRIHRESSRTGCRICPLMAKDPTRFEAPVIFCEVPRTRTFYLQRIGVATTCARNGVCRPHRTLSNLAREETNPQYAPRQKRPRKAWTAVILTHPSSAMTA